jgi:hypothetical protein
MINPELEVGDRVIIFHMEDKHSVPIGTRGTVTHKAHVFGHTNYSVDWDNGSKLSILSDVDKWDKEENFKKRIKKKITEMTTTDNITNYRGPLVLAPRDWEKEQMGAFNIPASKYLNADLAYDSYDNKMERTKNQIKKQEGDARKKAKLVKTMFSQNDGDGNPINGYSPEGNKTPGTPKYIKKIANLPKSEYMSVKKNYKKGNEVTSKRKLVEDKGGSVEEFKNMIKNPHIFKNFNLNFLRTYLLAIRDSGITNMYAASPYLFMGRERIEHQFKYTPIHDEEAFEKVLEMADQSQAEMINGTIKTLESLDIEVNLENINRYLRKLSPQILEKYMLLF